MTALSVELPLDQENSMLSPEILTIEPRSLGFDRAYVRRLP